MEILEDESWENCRSRSRTTSGAICLPLLVISPVPELLPIRLHAGAAEETGTSERKNASTISDCAGTLRSPKMCAPKYTTTP